MSTVQPRMRNGQLQHSHCQPHVPELISLETKAPQLEISSRQEIRSVSL